MRSFVNGAEETKRREEERPFEMLAKEEENKKAKFFETMAPFYLDSILEHEQTRTAFKAFLQEQLCVENLLFWQAAQDYRILAKAKVRIEPVEVMRSGLNLWKTYLEPGSKFEVSLPSSTFNEIKSQLEKGLFGIYTFAKAQEQAYQDMLADSMPKFVKRPAYLEMLKSLAKDLAPQIVRNTAKEWKCKMCVQMNNRNRVACANCGYKHELHNFIAFETVLRHPLGQAVLQTWLKDRSRKRDVVILDFILGVTRLKNTPFSKEEQATQCSQMLDTVRPLVKYILGAQPEGSKKQVSVKLLVDSLDAMIERLRTNVYPRFVKSSVHRHFIHAIERLGKSEGIIEDDGGVMDDEANSDSEGHTDEHQPTPPLSPQNNSSRQMMDDLDDDDLDDFAAMLSRPKALSPIKVNKISEEVKAAERAKKFWMCKVCKKENAVGKDLCLNCGLHRNQKLDDRGKVIEGEFDEDPAPASPNPAGRKKTKTLSTNQGTRGSDGSAPSFPQRKSKKVLIPPSLEEDSAQT